MGLSATTLAKLGAEITPPLAPAAVMTYLEQCARIAVPALTRRARTYRFPTRILQRNLATVCLATDGDQLDLRPGENLGVDLPIITEHLCDGALSRGVSAY